MTKPKSPLKLGQLFNKLGGGGVHHKDSASTSTSSSSTTTTTSSSSATTTGSVCSSSAVSSDSSVLIGKLPSRQYRSKNAQKRQQKIHNFLQQQPSQRHSFRGGLDESSSSSVSSFSSSSNRRRRRTSLQESKLLFITGPTKTTTTQNKEEEGDEEEDALNSSVSSTTSATSSILSNSSSNSSCSEQQESLVRSDSSSYFTNSLKPIDEVSPPSALTTHATTTTMSSSSSSSSSSGRKHVSFAATLETYIIIPACSTYDILETPEVDKPRPSTKRSVSCSQRRKQPQYHEWNDVLEEADDATIQGQQYNRNKIPATTAAATTTTLLARQNRQLLLQNQPHPTKIVWATNEELSVLRERKKYHRQCQNIAHTKRHRARLRRTKIRKILAQEACQQAQLRQERIILQYKMAAPNAKEHRTRRYIKHVLVQSAQTYVYRHHRNKLLHEIQQVARLRLQKQTIEKATVPSQPLQRSLYNTLCQWDVVVDSNDNNHEVMDSEYYNNDDDDTDCDDSDDDDDDDDSSSSSSSSSEESLVQLQTEISAFLKAATNTNHDELRKKNSYGYETATGQSVVEC